MTEKYRFDLPVALTCPECGGTLKQENNDGLMQFRCHIGHVMTAETALAAQFTMLEARLQACFVSLKERIHLCRLMAADGVGNPAYKVMLASAAAEAQDRAQVIKNLLESEWIDTGQAYAAQMRHGGEGRPARPGS